MIETMENFEDILSLQAKNTPPSLVREILKVTQNDNIISFGGGLPNPISFPQEALAESMKNVVRDFGSKVFQYSTTAGLPALRQYIAERYNKKFNMDIVADDIIITTGSQQALDLLAKVLIDEGDNVLVEKPGYLGALQAFSQYKPNFVPIELTNEGINIDKLKEVLKTKKIKFGYIVPNFQNPTGITYSKKVRDELFEIMSDNKFVLIEDDPYGELRFNGEALPYVAGCRNPYSVILGSFSKIVTPGMRLGYMITKNPKLLKAVNTAKEAADLHTNIFSQYIIWDYLKNNDLDEHISKIKKLYKQQSSDMLDAIDKFFPKTVKHTIPDGGMFMWATLEEGKSAMDLFRRAIENNVAFVPGDPFYVDEKNVNTLRLNYTNSSSENIYEGIKRLGSLM